MKPLTQRRAFTGLMSVLATAFVVGISGEVFSGESDRFADVLKVSSLVFVGTTIASFIIWTLTHWRKASVLRGALAGALTAVMIIPLPTFAWAIKTEVLSKLSGGQDGFLTAFVTSIYPALMTGLYTFIDITKASLIAIFASLVVGAACSYYVSNHSPE